MGLIPKNSSIFFLIFAATYLDPMAWKERSCQTDTDVMDQGLPVKRL